VLRERWDSIERCFLKRKEGVDPGLGNGNKFTDSAGAGVEKLDPYGRGGERTDAHNRGLLREGLRQGGQRCDYKVRYSKEKRHNGMGQ